MEIAKECPSCGNMTLKSNQAVLMPFVSDTVFGWKPFEIKVEHKLKDLSLGKSYAICNSFTCNNCGMVFSDIRFSEEELAKLYKGYRGTEYTELRDKYESGYKELNKKLLSGYSHIDTIDTILIKYIEGDITVLDFGGDTGINTPLRNERSLLHIYDIGTNKLIEEDATRINKIERTYSVVVCSEVLEHVSYPLKTLEEVKSAMDESSILYIDVPIGHEKKIYWHEHINEFSYKSLSLLMERAGLEILEMGTLETWHLNLYYLVTKLKRKEF